MEQDPVSPEKEIDQRASSVDPSSIRSNPFEDEDTSRKRQRTSLHTSAPRSSSIEFTEATESAPGETSKSPQTSQKELANDPLASTLVMETTENGPGIDANVPSTTQGATSEAANAPQPQTPNLDISHHPPAGTPSNVALRPRMSDKNMGDSGAQARLPSAELEQEIPEDLPAYEEAVGGAEAGSLCADSGTPSEVLMMSDHGNDNPNTPAVDVITIDSDDDEDRAAEEIVTIISDAEDDVATLDDPALSVPYYQGNVLIQEHILRLALYLCSEENLSKELHVWIESYLEFLDQSPASMALESLQKYSNLWKCLPLLVTNNPRLRGIAYEVDDNPIYPNIVSFVRSYARLTAHFVTLDTSLHTETMFSTPYLLSLAEITERRTHIEDDPEHQQEPKEEQFYSALIDFMDYQVSETNPSGILDSLMMLLDFQASLPVSAESIERCVALCAMISNLIRELYRVHTLNLATGGQVPVLRYRLAVGLEAYKSGSAFLNTVTSKHMALLTPDCASRVIYALGKLVHIYVSMEPPDALPGLDSLKQEYPDISNAIAPHAFYMRWLICQYRDILQSSQLKIRLMAADNLAKDLVAVWQRYVDADQPHPLVRFVAEHLGDSGIVEYFLSPTCHPELGARCTNIIGFLAISRTFTQAQADMFWQSVTTMQEPTRLISAFVEVTGFMEYSMLEYFSQPFLTIPLSAFTPHMLDMCKSVVESMTSPKMPLHEPLDVYMPFKICLRLIRDSSITGDDGVSKYPEVQSFAQDLFNHCLEKNAAVSQERQRSCLYDSCIRDIDANPASILGSLSAILTISSYCNDRIVDMKYLLNEKNLTKLIIDKTEEEVLAGQPVLYGNANKPRRDILHFILVVFPESLTPDLSSRIWDLLVGKLSTGPADRETFWTIVNPSIGDTELSESNNFVRQCITQLIPALPKHCLCNGLFVFVREWLVQALRTRGPSILVEEARRESSGTSTQLADSDMYSQAAADAIALEQLWRVVLTIDPNTVETEAIRVLVEDVYIRSNAINCSTPEDRQMVHTHLVERCLRQLSSAAEQLKVQRSEQTETGQSEAGDNSLLFLRSVKVLQSFLVHFRELYPKLSTASPVLGPSAGIQYQAFDGAVRSAYKPLRIGRHNTVAHLIERLEEETGFYKPTIYAHGAPLDVCDVTKTLDDRRLLDVPLLVKRVESSHTTRPSDLFSRKWDLEGTILNHFQELWDFLGLEEDMAKEVFDLLKQLGACKNMCKLFEREGLSYTDILFANQPYKSLYSLYALRKFLDSYEPKAQQEGPSENTLQSSSSQALCDPSGMAVDGDSAEADAESPESSTRSKSASSIAEGTANALDTVEAHGDAPSPATSQELSPPGKSATPPDSILHTVAKLAKDALCDPELTRPGNGNVYLHNVICINLLELLELAVSGAHEKPVFWELLDAQLVSSLTRILFLALEANTVEKSDDLAASLFGTILNCCLRSSQCWEHFKEYGMARQLVEKLFLTTDTHPGLCGTVGEDFDNKVVFEDETPNRVPPSELREFFFQIFFDLIPSALKRPEAAETVLGLAGGCLDCFAEDKIAVDYEELLTKLGNLLLEYDTFEDLSKPDIKDQALAGLVSHFVMTYDQANRHGVPVSLPANFVTRLFWKHLYPGWNLFVASNDGSGLDLVAGIRIVQCAELRQKLVALILKLIRDTPEYLPQLVKALDELVPAEPGDLPVLSWHDIPWGFGRTQQLRSPSGYPGLRNLGNTCYFNSLMAQLFMNVEFRKFVLQVNPQDSDLTGPVHQIRRLFGSMQDGVERFIDTYSCTQTIKTYDETPIDPAIQMDVDEFYNLLFDRYEGLMKTADDKAALRSLYGGQIVQQIKSQECEHVSERLEPFSAIQCDIKGKWTLKKSLEAYIEGEIMEGDNKYKCSYCNKHVVAAKRSCLKDVPDNIILHLKRFEYDLRTGMRNKINEYFAFPDEIDMRPYTIDQLSEPDVEKPPDMFELVGILVHSGNAESGHYYSFVRERPSPKPEGHWVEFNDDVVTDWDRSLMAAQCFGGQDGRPSTGYSDGGKPSEKSFSAYMLFYQRRSSIVRQQEALESQPLSMAFKEPCKVKMPTAFAEYMTKGNASLLRRHTLFDPGHLPLVVKALTLVSDTSHGCSASHKLEDRAMQMALSTLEQVAARGDNYPKNFDKLFATIFAMAQKCALCSLAAYDYFAARPQVFQTLMQRAPHPLIRSGIGKGVICLLTKIKSAFYDNYVGLPREVEPDTGLPDVPDGATGGLDDKLLQYENGDMTGQREPTLMLRRCTILFHAQELIRILWSHIHVQIKAWHETFSFMEQFVGMGREEVAAFLDAGGLEMALDVLCADADRSDQKPQIEALLSNLERRRSVRTLPYGSLISVVNIVLGAMFPAHNVRNVRQAWTMPPAVANDTNRSALLRQNPDDDIPLTLYELTAFSQQQAQQQQEGQPAVPPISIFVRNLVGLEQNAMVTDAIIRKLDWAGPWMLKPILATLQVGCNPELNRNQRPYLRAAMNFIRNTTNRAAGYALMAFIADRCRVTVPGTNRRALFDVLRELYFSSVEQMRQSVVGAGGGRVADDTADTAEADEADDLADAEGDPNDDVTSDGTVAESSAFEKSLLADALRLIPVWAPELLCHHDTTVSGLVLEFLTDTLFDCGPGFEFSASEGGAARSKVVDEVACQLGIALMECLGRHLVQTDVRLPYSVVEAVQQIVVQLQPFYASSSHVAADGTITESAQALQFRQLSSVLGDLARGLSFGVDVDSEGAAESDEGNGWNDGSSEAEDLGDGRVVDMDMA